MISFLYYQFRKMLFYWRWSILMLTITILWLTMIADYASGYAFNMTSSIEGRIFKYRTDLEVERGNIVIFPWSDPILPDGVDHMTKRVMCLPGDRLSRKGLTFFCNDRRITAAKTHSFAGDPLTVFDWTNGIIPDGVFFAATAHPDGYDSRYYGFVPLEIATVLERKL